MINETERRPDETLEDWVERVRPLYKGDIHIEKDGTLVMRPWQTPRLPADELIERMFPRKVSEPKGEDSEDEYYSEADW